MSDRRSFLRGLAALPLIGGSVALIGKPTAAVVPVTDDLLDAYSQWLHYERRLLTTERYQHMGRDQMRLMQRIVPDSRAASEYHFPSHGDVSASRRPSLRAALVLSTVGCTFDAEAANG